MEDFVPGCSEGGAHNSVDSVSARTTNAVWKNGHHRKRDSVCREGFSPGERSTSTDAGGGRSARKNKGAKRKDAKRSVCGDTFVVGSGDECDGRWPNNGNRPPGGGSTQTSGKNKRKPAGAKGTRGDGTRRKLKKPRLSSSAPQVSIANTPGGGGTSDNSSHTTRSGYLGPSSQTTSNCSSRSSSTATVIDPSPGLADNSSGWDDGTGTIGLTLDVGLAFAPYHGQFTTRGGGPPSAQAHDNNSCYNYRRGLNVTAAGATVCSPSKKQSLQNNKNHNSTDGVVSLCDIDSPSSSSGVLHGITATPVTFQPYAPPFGGGGFLPPRRLLGAAVTRSSTESDSFSNDDCQDICTNKRADPRGTLGAKRESVSSCRSDIESRSGNGYGGESERQVGRGRPAAAAVTELAAGTALSRIRSSPRMSKMFGLPSRSPTDIAGDAEVASLLAYVGACAASSVVGDDL